MAVPSCASPASAPGGWCRDKEGDACGALGESTGDVTKHCQGFPLAPSPSSGAISLRTSPDFN